MAMLVPVKSFEQSISDMILAGRGNQWLSFEGTNDCYIRVGNRYIARNYVMCIQLANLNAPKPRQGWFTRLVTLLLPYGYPLYLENVMNDEWEKALIERHGWRKVFDRSGGFNDLLLIPVRTF